MAGWGGGYGNRIVLDHGLRRGIDLTTTYNHLTTIVRSSGHVGRGQLIGYSGTTGLSTGCHLHFETRQNGTPVNPRTWF
jgi:murein DD-endopeptidase MepM/ murein hydrolase activator NlpD